MDSSNQQKTLDSVGHYWSTIFTPPPRLTVSQWSERYRFLSKEYNARGGKFRLSAAPYQKEPMDSVHDDAVQSTTLIFGSQLGKTEIVMSVTGYFAHAEPAPQLSVQPTIEMAEAFSKERLAPTIRDTPCLREIIQESRSRDSGNTLLNKQYPGGNLAIAGANSPAGLAARPRRVVSLDEVDRFPPSAGTEGDPCKLAERRTDTFFNAVIFRTSTPTVKGASRIEEEYQKTDQRKWFVPCPQCNERFVFMWEHVKWPKGKPEKGYIECPHCAAHMTDKQRLAAVKKGEWRPTAPFTGARGYFLNGINSPFRHKKGFQNRIHQMIREFLAAKDNRQTLQTWTNTFLAETWEEEVERLTGSELIKRREDYGPEFPDDVLCLTAGVDTQQDRLEVEIDGWGNGYESWAGRYVVLPGDPLKPGVWEDLEDLLNTRFTTPSGHPLKVNAACIDSGGGKGTDTAVYKFTKPRFARRIFAIKGASSRGIPIAGSNPSRTNRQRCPVYRIGTDEAKRWIYSSLKIKEPGYNYFHYPANEAFGFDEKYFQMLTAEEQRVRVHKGRRLLEWHQVRQRNEALDLRVYSRAALEILNPNFEALIKARAKSDTSSPQKKSKSKNYRLKPRPASSPDNHAATDSPPESEAKPKTRRPRGRARKTWAGSL